MLPPKKTTYRMHKKTNPNSKNKKSKRNVYTNITWYHSFNNRNHIYKKITQNTKTDKQETFKRNK